MTTLADLRTLVTNYAGNYPLRQTCTASGDGVKTVFMLPDGNIDNGSVAVYVDTVLKTETTHWALDYNVGELSFVTAPGAGTDNISTTYYTVSYTDTQVDAAINQGIYKVWPLVAKTTINASAITLSSTTYEYALPGACAYLKRVDYRSSSTSPYIQEHGWRVVETGATRTLYLYNPQSTGTLRLHYISAPVELSDAAHTLETTALIPTRAKWAVVYYACSALKRQQLLRRSQSNVFHNAEKQNTVKLYELQRVIADFEAAAELELQRARSTPRTGAF